MGVPSANALWLGDPIRFAPGTGVLARGSLAQPAAFSSIFPTHAHPQVSREDHTGQAANRQPAHRIQVDCQGKTNESLQI